MRNRSKQRVTPWKKIGAIAFVYVLFAIGAVIGRLCWNHIRLPFHNPWHIHSLLATLGRNPNDTLARLIVFIAVPSLMLCIFYALRIHREAFLSDTADQDDDRRPSQWDKRMGWVLLAIMMLGAVLASLYIPTDISTGPLDTFHEGESIGLAALYERGAVPYKDFVIAHGPIQDPLRSVMAFKLFGHSIGATRAFTSAVKLLQFALLGLLLWLIFGREYVWAFSALGAFLVLPFIPLYNDSGHLMGTVATLIQRDVTTVASLASVIWLYRTFRTSMQSVWQVVAAAFLCGITAVGAMIYSADRGVFLTVAYVVLSAVLYVTYVRGKPFRQHYLLASLAGVVCAVLLLGYSVRWNLPGFVKYVFVTSPNAWDLILGFVYQIESPPFLGAVLLMAANTYWVTLQFLRQWRASRGNGPDALKAFTDRNFPELSLFLCSVLFLKSFNGRCDWVHVSIGLLPSFLLSVIIVFKHYAPLVVRGKLKTGYMGLIACLVLYWFVFGINGVFSQGLWAYNFPLRVPDWALVPVNYEHGAQFLRDNLRGDETYYTLTNEGIWYYLVDRPCPTRYPLVYFAAPEFMQREVIRDLRRNNVKLILMVNSHWCCVIDGFGPYQRSPILMAYINANYEPFQVVDDMQFWIRKNSLLLGTDPASPE